MSQKDRFHSRPEANNLANDGDICGEIAHSLSVYRALASFRAAIESNSIEYFFCHSNKNGNGKNRKFGYPSLYAHPPTHTHTRTHAHTHTHTHTNTHTPIPSFPSSIQQPITDALHKKPRGPDMPARHTFHTRMCTNLY